MKTNRDKRYASVTDMTGAEHGTMVKEIFSTITEKYDFLNHALSLGRDIVWRRVTAAKMNFFHHRRYLDVATGTGDLAIEVTRRHPQADVIAVDFVGKMITAARRKRNRYGLSSRITFLACDALHLPFSEDSFDVVGIAFGIRNIPDRTGALREMKRVLAGGGHCMVLEMNYPRQALFRRIYSLYLNRLLPSIARHFSRNPAAYHYLADSIIHFPSPQGFTDLMRKAGFEDIERYSLTLGITYLYIGRKPR